MSEDATAIDLRDPASFPYWSRDNIRFSDLDRVGHVNNVAFAVYAETGRVEMLETLYPGSTAGSGVGWVIVRLVVEFVGQAHYPGRVDIGTRVSRLGNSSCTLVQGLFDGTRCIGTSEAVCVWCDTRSGSALPLPDDLRTILAGYTGPTPPAAT